MKLAKSLAIAKCYHLPKKLSFVFKVLKMSTYKFIFLSIRCVSKSWQLLNIYPMFCKVGKRCYDHQKMVAEQDGLYWSEHIFCVVHARQPKV